MDAKELKNRTMRFAVDVNSLVNGLPKNMTCEVIGRQLVRSSTSLGANYRAACRAQSTADFIHKIAICEGESDESEYWLELLVVSGQVTRDRVERLLDESNQLTAIMTASRLTARRGR